MSNFWQFYIVCMRVLEFIMFMSRKDWMLFGQGTTPIYWPQLLDLYIIISTQHKSKDSFIIINAYRELVEITQFINKYMNNLCKNIIAASLNEILFRHIKKKKLSVMNFFFQETVNLFRNTWFNGLYLSNNIKKMRINQQQSLQSITHLIDRIVLICDQHEVKD